MLYDREIEVGCNFISQDPSFDLPFLVSEPNIVYSGFAREVNSGLYVGYYVDYTERYPYDTFYPITMDTLKHHKKLVIYPNVNKQKYKGSILVNEIWFELPPVVLIPSGLILLDLPSEVQYQGLDTYISHGYEAFMERTYFSISVVDNTILLLNPIKYVKQINHRIVSESERYF